jgi:serine/threonine-protein kinase
VDLTSGRTELMMGTPYYISPEQIRSTRDVDHRTDIWSLGVVMFEVLSGGIMPFREEREVTSLIAEVLEQPHRSLLDVAPNVPEGLAAIVDRCLMKNREDRYQTAADVALDLLPFAPLRSRASVERAVAAMQRAGLMASADYPRPSQPPASDRPVSGLRRGPRYSDPPPIVLEETVPSAKVEESALDADEDEEADGIDEKDRALRSSRARWLIPMMLAAGAALGVVSFLASSEAPRTPRDLRDGAPASVPPNPTPGAFAGTREPEKLAREAPAPTAMPAGTAAPPVRAGTSAPLTRPPVTRPPPTQHRAPANVPTWPLARPKAFSPSPAKPAASQEPPEPTPEPKLDVRRER